MTSQNYRSPELADRVAALLSSTIEVEVDHALAFRFERVELSDHLVDGPSGVDRCSVE